MCVDGNLFWFYINSWGKSEKTNIGIGKRRLKSCRFPHTAVMLPLVTLHNEIVSVCMTNDYITNEMKNAVVNLLSSY